MSFAIDLSKQIEQRKSNIDQIVRGTVIGVLRGVDRRSPVGDKERWAANVDRASRGLRALPAGYIGGRFRASNLLSVNFQTTSVADQPDPTGERTMEANVSQIPKEAAGLTFFIVNALPYAESLELGHSTQAPLGIYEITSLEFNQTLAAAAAETPL